MSRAEGEDGERASAIEAEPALIPADGRPYVMNGPAESDEPPVAAAPVRASDPPSAEDFGRVFLHLVESDEDVVGLVSYGLYKQEKRGWLTAWQERQGRVPSPDQFAAFISANLTPGQRARYRNAARAILDEFASANYEREPAAVIEDEAAAERENRFTRHVDRVAERVEVAADTIRGASRFSRLVLAGFVGALIMALIGAALIWAVQAGHLDGVLDLRPPASGSGPATQS